MHQSKVTANHGLGGDAYCNTAVRTARDGRIDAIKGGAILLVILGHAIQYHVCGFDDNLLFRIIYSFHMPLFMILSGWFAVPETLWRLRKTAVRLVIPVFSWYLILYAAQGQYRTMSLVELARQWIKSPDVGLWFLWVLFLCHLWLVPMRRLEARIGLLAYVVGVVALLAIPFSSFGLTLTKYYFPFFVLGYLVARYWKRLMRYSHVALALSVLVFPLALHYWHRTSAGLPSLDVLLAGHQLHLAIPVMLTAKLVCAMSGSVIFAYLLTATAFLRPVGTLLAWLGTQTLEIYVIQQPLISLSVGKGFIAIIAWVVIALIISLGAIWVLRKSEWSSLALFGRIPRNWDRRVKSPIPDSNAT